MDIAKDIREFLMTRRARLRPEDAGLPFGHRRRVPGLRREEVAQLSGVSTEYYTKIERGKLAGVSDEVLNAVARALRLTDDETAHFFNLARAAAATRIGAATRRTNQHTVPDGMQALMDSMHDAPAIVMTGCLDILAANPLGRALYAPVFERATGIPNLAPFIFFAPAADHLFPQWKATADEAVGLLRAEAARSPQSPAITQIVGELATRSDEFRTRWAAHNVTAHRHGTKRFRHPAVGELTLTYNVLGVTAATGLSLVGYTAEPNSQSAQAIQILGSWAVTQSSIDRSGADRDRITKTTE
ncbi:putative DNA-binding protein [Mycobacteroides abscessus subsp. massiliense]|uniref:helix-turn-helix domain-containing protein n=1 Tax=Mycobacteroides abscessus TaxID=36809 RepID=UPI0009A8F362|nr:helix-turn-helix transcriptional regulator [Mycobacteroides abscessus]SKF99203.1 putative DNA-binding protein [Mycobacteroides abscessus subsp. massiliense]SKG35577.1 putative DNA-binding protein [Mycobacteroides abscessus subsp. massiliense]SKJ04362.1 putative DNA-binding protein [Mycobacteroides abscessus subsp. massiliense]SKJ42388.1 putative DNA-binding protein [Mycobacteroides abscessus subsp. massiliense]SKL15989.1 putative DNA-binding protein [Mycobacteroides abscessus subsp. massili